MTSDSKHLLSHSFQRSETQECLSWVAVARRLRWLGVRTLVRAAVIISSKASLGLWRWLMQMALGRRPQFLATGASSLAFWVSLWHCTWLLPRLQKKAGPKLQRIPDTPSLPPYSNGHRDQHWLSVGGHGCECQALGIPRSHLEAGYHNIQVFREAENFSKTQRTWFLYANSFYLVYLISFK